MERDENGQRKPPTNSERVALAQAIEPLERERAKQRQLAALAQNRSGNISGTEDPGDVRDIVAQKVGLGSGKTLEAAQKVVERGIPELVEAMAERLQGRVGNPELHANSGNISGIEQGRTKDIAAAKAGLGSGKTCNHPRAARSSNHPLTTGADLAHDEHATETEVAGIGTPESKGR